MYDITTLKVVEEYTKGKEYVELYHNPNTNEFAIQDSETGRLVRVTFISEEEDYPQTQALTIADIRRAIQPIERERHSRRSSLAFPLVLALSGVFLVMLVSGRAITTKAVSVPQHTMTGNTRDLALALRIPQGRWPYVIEAWNDAVSSGIDPRIFVRQMNQESGFQTNLVSPAGAIGIAQIIPATSRAWQVNPNNPDASLQAASEHMAWYVRTYHSYQKALACYNGGCGVMLACTQRATGFLILSCLPSETRNYIYVILG